jgi:hypothetical protein
MNIVESIKLPLIKNMIRIGVLQKDIFKLEDTYLGILSLVKPTRVGEYDNIEYYNYEFKQYDIFDNIVDIKFTNIPIFKTVYEH